MPQSIWAVGSVPVVVDRGGRLEPSGTVELGGTGAVVTEPDPSDAPGPPAVVSVPPGAVVTAASDDEVEAGSGTVDWSATVPTASVTDGWWEEPSPRTRRAPTRTTTTREAPTPTSRRFRRAR